MPGQHQIDRADALLVVDVQADFLPGGALGVPDGDAVVAPLNRCIEAFARAGRPMYFSRDWHPWDHCSFAQQGGPWPPHCVAGTPGAAFAPGLQVPDSARVISKATRPDRDAYSAFQDTALAERLHAEGIRRVIVGGLATDYCVRETACDARSHGFDVAVLSDAIRAVNVQPGDAGRALQEMRARGVRLTDSAALLRDMEAG